MVIRGALATSLVERRFFPLPPSFQLLTAPDSASTPFVIAYVGCLPWFLLTVGSHVVGLTGLVEVVECIVLQSRGREEMVVENRNKGGNAA